jgi:hypothetical protein
VDAPKASGSARMAVYYLTTGSLLLIWSVIWLLYLRNHTPSSDTPFYIVWGLLFTGVVLSGIGLAIGRIGRSARKADVVQAPMGAGTVPMPANGAPVMTPNGQVLAPAAPMVVVPSATPGTVAPGAVPMVAATNGVNGGVGGKALTANAPVSHLP